MGMPERQLHFVGVDLAWGVVPAPLSTGFCVLDDAGRLMDWRCLTSDDEVIENITAHIPCWVAIDASLFVPNRGGMRDVEKLLRARGVKVLPTSKVFLDKHCGGSRGEALVASLAPSGFTLENGAMPVLETFPRAILHATLGKKMPRYKTGPKEVRTAGCVAIATLLEGAFPDLGEVVARLPGDPRQAADMIDALACAICVYAHWRYEGERTTPLHGEDGTHVLLLREDHV
jgi:predicted nuclease with RNAse H fold